LEENIIGVPPGVRIELQKARSSSKFQTCIWNGNDSCSDLVPNSCVLPSFGVQLLVRCLYAIYFIQLELFDHIFRGVSFPELVWIGLCSLLLVGVLLMVIWYKLLFLIWREKDKLWCLNLTYSWHRQRALT